MENSIISKEKLIKIKDGILFTLLFLWMIMPILHSFKIVYKFVNVTEIYFILMKAIGIVGIGLSIYEIYTKIRYAENKKDAIKQLLPIFLFTIYMGWTLISCMLSLYKKTVYEGTSYRREGYYMYLNYAGFFLCAFWLKSEKLRKVLLNTFIMSAIVLIVASRLPLKIKKISKIFINNSPTRSMFGHYNHYGYFLMMALMCSLGLFIKEKNKLKKIIYLILYTIIGYSTIFNNTFGCYLAVSIVLGLYGIYSLIKKRDRKNILILITIFIILSCYVTRSGKNVVYSNIKNFVLDISIIITKMTGIEFKQEENNEEKAKVEQSENTQNTENSEKIEDTKNTKKQLDEVGTDRILLWRYGIKFIARKPIFGYGPDNLKREYMLEGIEEQDRTHNLIIYLAGVSGIPGMLIYMTAVGIIVIKGIKNFIRQNKEGSVLLIIVVTYLISSMFGNSMFYTSPYFFIFLGSLMKLNLEKKEC